MPHILFAISPHGFGHAAMVAPVINALHQALPAARFTLRTTLSPAFLASRIAAPYRIQSVADDFGMVQHNALEVDVAASAARYRELHERWERRVEEVAAVLIACDVDLVVADVPYLTLAAAQRAGIANVALCCLHWGDIYGHYCLGEPGAEVIHRQIMAAYRGVDRFLRTEPAMPMSELPNLRTIGPLASRGINRRDVLAQQLALSEGERLVLIAMGGIGFRLPMEQWPEFPGVRFIVQRDWQVARSDTVVLEDLPLPYADLLASCDLLLTKPGYGSFSEAAVNGIPVLYVPRPDWPESPWLIRWLERYGHCAAVERGVLERGAIAGIMESLWAAGRCVPHHTTGVTDTITHLLELLPQQ